MAIEVAFFRSFLGLPHGLPRVASTSGATLSTAQEGPHRTSQLLALRATTEGEEGRRGRLKDVRRWHSQPALLPEVLQGRAALGCREWGAGELYFKKTLEFHEKQHWLLVAQHEGWLLRVFQSVGGEMNNLGMVLWSNDIWLVGSNIFYDFPYIGKNNPNWRTPSFFRGLGQPPTSQYPVNDTWQWTMPRWVRWFSLETSASSGISHWIEGCSRRSPNVISLWKSP